MSIDWVTGFEGGIISASGGGIFNNISGTPAVETSIKHSGNYAMRLTPTGAGAVNGRRNLPASTQVLVARAYVHVPTGGMPGSTVNIFGTVASGTSDIIGVTIMSSGEWRGVVGSNNVTGATVTTDVWHRIDIRVNITGTTWTLDWKIDGVDQTQVTLAGQLSTDSLTIIRMGSSSTTVSMDIIFDDVATGNATGDYPILGDSTVALKPNADGTHNAGTNIIEANDGTDIGTTTAWDKLDDIPINGASNYVRQAANGASNYAEISFEDLSVGYSAIQAACALLAYTSESTSSNTGGCIVSKDSFSTQSEVYGTDSAPLDMSDGNTSSPFYKAGIVAGVNSGTLANAIKARMGYSTDASPDPYWLNLIIEVSYTASTSTEGSLSKTQANDFSSGAGTLLIQGTLSKSQAGNTIVANADLILKGALAKAQAGDTLSANGKIAIKGTANKSQSGDSLSSQADLIAKGSLNKLQASNTISATGKLLNEGALSINQSDNTLIASGDLSIKGSLNRNQDDQTLSADGSGSFTPIEGSLNQSQQGDTIDAAAQLILEASLDRNQAGNTLTAVGRLQNNGTMIETQASDTLLSSGSVAIRGALSRSQASNTIQAQGISPRRGALNRLQQNNVMIAAATLLISGELAVNQSNDTMIATGDIIKAIEGPGRLSIIQSQLADVIQSEEVSVIYADDR